MRNVTCSWGTLVVLLLSLNALTQGTSYEGDEIIEIDVHDDAERSVYDLIIRSYTLLVNLWRQPLPEAGTGALVHVPSSLCDRFKTDLTKANLTFKIAIPNLQKLVDNERKSNPAEGVPHPWSKKKNRKGKRDDSSSGSNSILGKYATYEELRDWLSGLKSQFPNLVELITIGETYEGRELFLIKIGDQKSMRRKPGIWLDAGTHAREWITVSSAVYIISQILSDHWNRTEELKLVGDIDWYIVPLINPDGYAYTHNVNGSRFWRKNRSRYNTSYSAYYDMWCRGTDINRNFDFNWAGEGASTDPCLETYCGPTPTSENETQAIETFLSEHNDTIRGYVTIHSFGQLFMVRWAYSIDAPPPPEINETMSVARDAVSAINRTSGVLYTAGTSPQILYSFTGGSGDWVRNKTGIKHAYDVELRDKGDYGFALPADYILPVGEEIWAGIKVVAEQVLEDFPPYDESTYAPSTVHVYSAGHYHALSLHCFCLLLGFYIVEVLYRVRLFQI